MTEKEKVIQKIPLREEIPAAYTWALEDLYSSDEEWKKDIALLRQAVGKIAAFQGKLCQSAQGLLSYLQYQDELTVLMEKCFHYALRRADQDTRNSLYQGYASQVRSLSVELGSAMAFAEPEILSIPEERMEQYYLESSELAVYKRYLHDIRRKKAHVLSNEEERLLAMADDMAGAPGNVFSLLHNADMTFLPVTDSEGISHELTQGSFIPMLQNPDRAFRKEAFTHYYQTVSQLKNTSAALLSAQVKQLMFYAKARKYPSTLHAALDNTHVDVAVYHNLIEAVHENMPSMYQYVKLRKKLLGVDELHMYDLYVPMVSDAAVSISFEEAKEYVLQATSVLGETYTSVLKEGFANRWIDVYENVGKRSGAYSCGVRVHPYVLLNHKNDLHSAFTLAHEMGHALHSFFSNITQPVIDADYAIFVAEVASTCNEALLMQYLLSRTTDKKQRAYFINYFLEQFRTTLYRQTMFAEFELKINELAENGGSITADSVSAIYHDLIHLYFGEDIVQDKEIDLEWARIPHFFYNYYVYQYATGFSAAIALSRRILKEGAPAVKDYLRFLSSGCSKDPVSLLKDAGVDMSTKKPVEEALLLFHELIEEMEQLTTA